MHTLIIISNTPISKNVKKIIYNRQQTMTTHVKPPMDPPTMSSVLKCFASVM